MKKVVFHFFVFSAVVSFAPPVSETGGRKEPGEPTDRTKEGKVVKLMLRKGTNMNFHFHNNPFVGSKLIFERIHDHRFKTE